MKIGERETQQNVVLIAEVGNNHEGSVERAVELVEAAFAAGADAVKLQTFEPELYVSSLQFERLAMLRRFALPTEELQRLLLHYKSRNLTLFTTPFDLTSLGRVSAAPLIKISSGDITFTQLLEASARTEKDLIISTGASTLMEVQAAVDLVTNTWRELGFEGRLAVLHCVSSYPAPPHSVNLRAIETLRSNLPNVVIGYSDHCLGIDVALTAAAAGARIIEKHFTLDKSYSDFRDHQLSADPSEFKQLRERLDELDTLLGTGIKEPQDVEIDMRVAIRRSLTASRDLAIAHQLEESDLCIVRPGEGLTPHQLNETIGRRLVTDMGAGEPLFESNIE